MIASFTGEFRFLSNFWPAEVMLDGDVYPTVEHAYQAAKTMDAGFRFMIRTAPTPGRAKSLGRAVPLRAGWDFDKLSVMAGLLEQKFNDSNLFEKLLSTRPRELVEGNTWGDTFWGVCRGRGENHLGKLLMKIREESV